jgi:DNA-binding IclR family transcriptional regulator
MSDLGDTYRINDAQQRVAQILVLLAGREAEGLPQGAICKAGKWAGSKVHNDLRNLREAGLAERLENGNWRLAPKLVQIAIAHQQGIARIQDRLSELQQRYSRHPN